MLVVLFSISLFLILYCYILYPCAIYFLSKGFSIKHSLDQKTPFISVIIAAHNEEAYVQSKIYDIMQQQYPQDQIEILIGSDGSTDGTSALILQMQKQYPQIKALVKDERQGKPQMLNDLIPKARGEIIVFNDVRQSLKRDAFRNIVRHFADPQIGCVSGELIFNDKDSVTAKGIQLYWEYEKMIRHAEARLGSMLGATGAFYAIRKSLFKPIKPHLVLDDMFTPLSIVSQGYRAIADEDAIAYDNPSSNPQEEYRRKTRTLFGNYQIFQEFPHLLIPGVSPIAIQLFSHKLLRLMIPLLMILLFILNFFLLDLFLFQCFLVLQSLFYLMAFTGFLIQRMDHGNHFWILRKLCYIPYVFCLLNFSALIGLYRFIFSKQDVLWTKAKT